MTGAVKPSHEQLQQSIVDLLHVHGWRHLHCRRSIGKGHRWVTATNLSGWPDLLAWSIRQPGRHLAIEVKVPPDKLRPEQAAVLAELGLSGFECFVVYPDTFYELAAALPRRSPHTAG